MEAGKDGSSSVEIAVAAVVVGYGMRLLDSLMAPRLLLEQIPPPPPDWRSVRGTAADMMKTQVLVHARYFAGGN